MIRRSKRLRAFTTGCLASLVVFGYPSQLLAQSNSSANPIQGITSTTQEAPATAAEVNDVMTGLAAGVGIGDLLQPKPDPTREHTAFMSSMWNVLLDSDYISDTSSLTTSEWITGPTGILTATNETGNTLSIDIALSLEILPEQFSSVDQESLDFLSAASARIGIAWTTMTGIDQVQSNILVWWYQWSDEGGTQTAIGPLDTIDQADIDMWRNVVPLMGDFFDNPLHYNIENYDSSMFGAWSRFRSRVGAAVTTAVSAVVGTMVRAAVIAAVATAGTATTVAIAAATVIGAVAAAIILVAGMSYLAYQNLLDDLEAAGYPVDFMLIEEIAEAALNLGLIIIV